MTADRRLEVFVHIGKTAGSTLNAMLLDHHAGRLHPRLWPVLRAGLPAAWRDNALVNRYLARRFAQGCPHFEFHENDPGRDAILRRAAWVSGHIQRRRWEGMLAGTGRPVAWHTILREPTAQVASHYQWWIEIHAGNRLRYWRYGRFWRSLSERIRATDNTDPAAIIAILAEHHSLFLNLQTDYVAGPQHRLSADQAEAALARFASVGLDTGIGPVFTAMTGVSAPQVPRLNQSRAPFDRAVFHTPQMQAFLAERNAADIALYAAARRMRGV